MAKDETERSDRNLVLRGLGWSSLGYPLNVGSVFLSQVLAAKLLRPGEFGAYSLAVSIFTLVALVAQLGLPQSLLRGASAALMGNRPAEARQEIVAAFAMAALAAAVAGALVGSRLGSWILEHLFPDTAVAALAALIGVRVGIRVIENLVPEIIRAFRDYFRVALYDGLLAGVLLCLALIVMLATTEHPSANDVLLASVATAAIALVPALVTVVARVRRLPVEHGRRRNPIETAIWLSMVGRALIAQLDLLVVGAVGDGREVGLYAAAFRLALLVGFPLLVVNQVVMPLIAGWYAQGATARLERTLRSTAGLALIVAALLALVCAVGGGTLLSWLFGPDYEDAWAVLAILAAGQVVQTWAGSCGYAMMLTGFQRIYAWILGISGVITLALDIALYEAFGIEGVALATAAMLAAQNLVQVWVLRRRAGFSTLADPVATLRDGIGRLRGR